MQPSHVELKNIDGVNYLVNKYQSSHDEDKIPCKKLGYSITNIRLSPGNEVPMTELRCGSNDLICIECISYLNLLEEQNNSPIENSIINIDDDDDDEIDTSGLWNSIKRYASSPWVKGFVGVLGVSAGLGLGYGAYRLLRNTDNNFNISKREYSNQNIDNFESDSNTIRNPLDSSTSSPVPKDSSSASISQLDESIPSASLRSTPTVTTKNRILTIHHKKSTLEAVQALHIAPETPVDTLFELKPGCSRKELINCIFDQNSDLTHNEKIKWSSSSKSSPAFIVRLNKLEFQKALACSIIESDSIKGMSVETLTLPASKERLQKTANLNKINTQLERIVSSVDGTEEISCRTLEDEQSIRVFDIRGEMAVDIQKTECRPTFTTHKSQSLLSEINKETENLCIDRVVLISEGVDASSNIAQAVQNTITFDSPSSAKDGYISGVKIEKGAQPLDRGNNPLPNVAEEYIKSALRRCPNLKITDIRAATTVHGKSSSSASISVLSQQKIVQALDHLLIEEKSEPSKSKRIVIIEPSEVDGYYPNSRLTEALAFQLNTTDCTVLHYAGSSSSWLTQTSNIKTTSSLSETVVSNPALPRRSILVPIGSTLAVLGLGLVAMLRYLFIKRKTGQEIKANSSENIELEDLQNIEDEEDEESQVAPTDPELNNENTLLMHSQESVVNKLLHRRSQLNSEETGGSEVTPMPRSQGSYRLINSAKRIENPWQPYPIRQGIIKYTKKINTDNNTEDENTSIENNGH